MSLEQLLNRRKLNRASLSSLYSLSAGRVLELRSKVEHDAQEHVMSAKVVQLPNRFIVQDRRNVQQVNAADAVEEVEQLLQARAHLLIPVKELLAHLVDDMAEGEEWTIHHFLLADSFHSTKSSAHKVAKVLLNL